jgi:hypothetical protein
MRLVIVFPKQRLPVRRCSAIELVKLSQGLPAVLAVEISADALPPEADIITSMRKRLSDLPAKQSGL